MVAKTVKQVKNSDELSEIDLNYKIEIASQTLDRNIGFVTTCDNKTSIVLSVIGFLLTMILTNEGLNVIFTITKNCINSTNWYEYVYLFCLAGTFVVLIWGMIRLGSVLVGKFRMIRMNELM